MIVWVIFLQFLSHMVRLTEVEAHVPVGAPFDSAQGDI
jgi:hypothetical protein